MMDAIRSWIFTLAGTALVCSAAVAVTPAVGAKKIVKLVCGFASMIALISLVADIDLSSFSSYAAEYREKGDALSEEAYYDAANATRFIIEEKCAAYILDKAAELGAGTIGVSVTAKWSEDGYWYPICAYITGEITEDAREKLCRMMEADLGIAREGQMWREYDQIK